MAPTGSNTHTPGKPGSTRRRNLCLDFLSLHPAPAAWKRSLTSPRCRKSDWFLVNFQSAALVSSKLCVLRFQQCFLTSAGRRRDNQETDRRLASVRLVSDWLVRSGPRLRARILELTHCRHSLAAESPQKANEPHSPGLQVQTHKLCCQ